MNSYLEHSPHYIRPDPPLVNNQSNKFAISKPMIVLIVLIVFTSSLTLLSGVLSVQHAVMFETTVKMSHSSFCQESCGGTKLPPSWSQRDDLLDPTTLVRILSTQKEALVTKLKSFYGEYFDKIFVDTRPNMKSIFDNSSDVSYRPFQGISEASAQLLKDKIMMKLLSLQLTYRKGGQEMVCDCNRNQTYLGKYVWVTAGHSTAAGHGNLYSESYTAHIWRNLRPFFASVGIDFIARNHAIGNFGSYPEATFCWKELYGTDVDIFTYDFGMTDGSSKAGVWRFGYAGATSPGHPAMISLKAPKQKKIFSDLQERGDAKFFPIIQEDMKSWLSAIDVIPDCAVLSSEEVESLPIYLKKFKCNGVLERKCGEKYSVDVCPVRRGRVSWHPGFKSHALVGSMLSLFLADAFVAAAKDLENSDIRDLQHALQEREANEHASLIKFANSSEPAFPSASFVDAEVKIFDLLKGPSLCHTARLPSQIRYLGHLSNSEKKGGPAPFGKEQYDVGINFFEAVSQEGIKSELRLVWHNASRQPCPVTLAPDYKDFFFASSMDGWAGLSVPNSAEKRAYDYNPNSMKGILFFVNSDCSGGSCPAGHLPVGSDSIKQGTLKVKINGLIVTNFLHADGFLVARNKDSFHFPKNDEGAYNIEFKVLKTNSFVRISSIILF